MVSISFYFAFLLFSSLKLAASAGLRCHQVLNSDAVFSLEPLSSNTDYQYTYTSDSKSYTLYYNFCKFTSKTCNSKSSYAFLVPLDSQQRELNDSCIHLTSNNILSNYEYSLNNPDDPSLGIQIKFTEGDVYNETLKYEISFKIYCDKGDLSEKFILDELILDNNQYIAIGRSANGCPLVQISEVYKFILDNKYIFGILSIFFGIIECFFGLAILKPSLFIVGYISAFGFVILIFGEFLISPDMNVLLIWILLIIAVLLGAVVGYLVTTLPKLGFMALGLWFGFVLAFVINNLFLYKIEVDPPELLLYILMGILGIIFAVLSMYIWRELCIIATSFLGAYLIIRSLSLYIGYYPNELSLNIQIKYKELANVGWEFYIYFIFLIILTILGAFVQFRNKKKIGGKYAGDFEKEDLEEKADTYVEMDNFELKKPFSVIHEESKEETEVNEKISKHTFNLSQKKDFLGFSGEKKQNFSKSAKISVTHGKEEIPEKKSFQGMKNQKQINFEMQEPRKKMIEKMENEKENEEETKKTE